MQRLELAQLELSEAHQQNMELRNELAEVHGPYESDPAADLASLKTALDDLTVQMDTLSKTSAEKESIHQDTIEALVDQMRDKETEKETLSQQLAACQSIIEQQEDTIEALREELAESKDRYKSELMTLQSKCDAQQEQAQQRLAQVQQQREQLEQVLQQTVVEQTQQQAPSGETELVCTFFTK